MPERRPSSISQLRSTLDRILIHDIKNVGFRLQLLLTNLEEHYGDPEFKRSVRDLLSSTIERLDGIVGRYSAHPDAVLIKVALDLNAVLREAAARPPRRGEADTGELRRLAPVTLSLGAVPEVWGDPYYLSDALASLVENAREAAAPDGRVLVRSFRDEGRRRAKAVVEIIDNGSGMSLEFIRERLFQPFHTTKPDGVGLGLATASEIVRLHRGTIRIHSRAGGGTLVRLKFPGSARTAADDSSAVGPPAGGPPIGQA
ncbi:MAG TPA: ATP-binding protein [Thermoanaerobaculia bacterium]|nr:ATP-binding protein [Thermoanaerobaculia bacterium]